MAVIGMTTNVVWGATIVAKDVANWVVDGPSKVCADVDSLSDFMKLVQKVNDIFKELVRREFIGPIAELLPLGLISAAFSQVTEFVSARGFIKRISGIVSGEPDWCKRNSVAFPDLLRIASKCAYLVGDLASTAKWLSSIHVLGPWVKEATGQFKAWGQPFKLLKGVGDVSCITGAMFDMADTFRLIAGEALQGAYVREGSLRMSLILDRALDLASDISKIAGSVLSNIPGVDALFTLVSLAIGSTLSLAKFFKKAYFPEQHPGLMVGMDMPKAMVAEEIAVTGEENAEMAGGDEDEMPADFEAIVEEGLRAQANLPTQISEPQEAPVIPQCIEEAPPAYENVVSNVEREEFDTPGREVGLARETLIAPMSSSLQPEATTVAVLAAPEEA